MHVMLCTCVYYIAIAVSDSDDDGDGDHDDFHNDSSDEDNSFTQLGSKRVLVSGELSVIYYTYNYL